MHPHQQQIDSFYGAFARLDADAMGACYADEVMFDDEVFSLRGKAETVAMWRMLCESVRAHGGDAWRLEWTDLGANEYEGGAHWEAWYPFGPRQRRVHQRVQARFGFNDAGLIAVHRDRFDFWRWSRQALGFRGLLLGWSDSLRRQVRRQAAARLQGYRQTQPR
jgi:hypothetical protein